MKISYNWLKDFIRLKESPEKIAEILTMQVAEVEKIEQIGSDKIVVGQVRDYVLEIDNRSLTHRADLFSHFGFARELGAILGKASQSCSSAPKPKSPRNNLCCGLTVEIEAKKLCPRYMAVVLDNVRIGPSPSWMQQRLQACGLRPINNVVDITNYVMLEIGEPLHAFDYVKLKNQTIRIRTAKKGEKIKTLEGKTYKLDNSMLVIADAEKPVALAGIIGGEASGINNTTQTIVIEAANFDKTSIRQTSQKLNLRTESSLRFEKGLGLNFAEEGIYRCIELLQKYANAKVASRIFDLGQKPRSKKIKLALSHKDKLILRKLGFKFQVKNVVVPVWRTDIEIAEDIFEEIARLSGYNKITPEPLIAKLQPIFEDKVLFWSREVRNILVGWGFTEVYNYSFASHGKIALKNPIAPELEYLRSSLKEKLTQDKTFEIGHVFTPEERKHLAFFCEDYFAAKGAWECLLKKLNIKKQIGQLDPHGKVEIDLEELSKLANYNFRYKAIPKYPPVRIDLAVALDRNISWGDFVKEVKYPLLVEIELFDIYEKLPNNQKSFAMHLTFQANRTLTMNEVEKFREEIVKKLNKKFKAAIRK